MLHKEFWGLLFLAFVGWIFISASPTQRIDHACRPVGWVGNIATSVTSLLVQSQQANVQKWFDKFEYGCQYMTWRLIYQADYNKAMGVDANKLHPSDVAAPASAKDAASTPVTAPASK
jgi:hypothetical protein